MPKTVTLRLNDEAYQQFAGAARAENRSLANLIETAALERLREQQFIDDYEMADILANDELIGRLRQGSRDAGKLLGRFVE